MKRVYFHNMLRYILPAMGGLLISYLYNIVDGIFVGQGVGADALGAVNVAVPYITISMALSSIFPMGASAIIANSRGKGDKRLSNQAFVNGAFLTIVFAILITALGMLFPSFIVDISGGASLSQSMKDLASEYLFFYSAFQLPFLLANALSIFVRNDDDPNLALFGMIAGALANILLDYIFVYPLSMGVAGAAIASGLGQILSFLILITHFIRKKGELRLRRERLSISLSLEITKRGLPEAASQLSTPISSLCYNWVLAQYIGDLGVSTWSVLSFVASLCVGLLTGVGQGLQPLFGQAYGKGDKKEGSFYLKWGIIISLLIGSILFLLCPLLPGPISSIFTSDGELIASSAKALPYFAISFVPMGASLVMTYYLFSSKKGVSANLLSLSRGVFLKVLFIFLLPLFLPIEYVWLAYSLAEVVGLLLGLGLLLLDGKGNVEESKPQNGC